MKEREIRGKEKIPERNARRTKRRKKEEERGVITSMIRQLS